MCTHKQRGASDSWIVTVLIIVAIGATIAFLLFGWIKSSRQAHFAKIEENQRIRNATPHPYQEYNKPKRTYQLIFK